MSIPTSIVLLAATWLTAGARGEPGGAAQSERIWVLTDQAAWTSAVIGIEVGTPDTLLFVVRSKTPTVFHAFDLFDDDRLAVVEGGGLTFGNKLRMLDSSTGKSMSTAPVKGGGWEDLEVFPGGSMGLATLQDPYLNHFVRIDEDGTQRVIWPFPMVPDDMHVDDLGRVWVTSKPTQVTRCYDTLGNQLEVLGFGGSQLATSPQGTLWFAGTGAIDLLHVTQEGQVLAAVDVPSLVEVSALSVDSAGKVWVSGHGADRVECFRPDGTHVRTVLLPGPVGVRHITTR